MLNISLIKDVRAQCARTMLTPSLITENDTLYMFFGTPEDDKQDQWTLQFFLNYVDLGMNVQEALDAPTVHTNHFPGGF
jgi:gamma-glutamyltranspeptidase/glutathione hydrolase